jgi:hypothetical protein
MLTGKKAILPVATHNDAQRPEKDIKYVLPPSLFSFLLFSPCLSYPHQILSYILTEPLWSVYWRQFSQGEMKLPYSILSLKHLPGVVTHACNPSYMGGKGRSVAVQGQPRQSEQEI